VIREFREGQQVGAAAGVDLNQAPEHVPSRIRARLGFQVADDRLRQSSDPGGLLLCEHPGFPHRPEAIRATHHVGNFTDKTLRSQVETVKITNILVTPAMSSSCALYLFTDTA
jgi:hypothetical protein